MGTTLAGNIATHSSLLYFNQSEGISTWVPRVVMLGTTFNVFTSWVLCLLRISVAKLKQQKESKKSTESTGHKRQPVYVRYNHPSLVETSTLPGQGAQKQQLCAEEEAPLESPQLVASRGSLKINEINLNEGSPKPDVIFNFTSTTNPTQVGVDVPNQ